MTDIENRLVDLEVRFMKLERFAHELSDVVAAQQRTIDVLSAEAKRWREQTLGVTEGDKPPHY